MSAPTAIIYDGKRLIPAPRLQFSRSHRRSGDKSIIGTEHQVTITGTLVGCKGWDFSGASPVFYSGSDYPVDDPNTTCNKFANLVQMQEALRNLFSVDGDYKWFEIIGCEGENLRKWKARTLSIDFTEGNWTDVVPYTIVLGLQTDYIEDEDLHIDHTENWDVQFDEEQGGIYKLTHTVSTQSEEFVTGTDSEGWRQAKLWVDARLGNTNKAEFGLGAYTEYDYTVQKSIDDWGGTYSATETWTLSKHPVFRTWTITYSDPRDDYVTVSIEGEFKSFLNRTSSTETTPGNGDAAIDAFNTWGDDGAYGEVYDWYTVRDGCGTLGVCPVSKTVTITEESRGDDSVAFGEATRMVRFSYEFSDSDSDAEVSITRASQTSNFELCETRVTISGNIQGHTCDCGTTQLGNAQTAYATINCVTEAAAIYTGSGTLVLVNSTYTENERDGTIEFSCEFSDRFVDGEIQEERISIGWVCGDLKTGGVSKTTYSVEGSIKATCDGSVPTAPNTSTYTFGGVECILLKRTTVTTDEEAMTVTYSYEWDDDCGPGLMEITVEKTLGPDNCSYWETNVDLKVQGVGCTSEDMLNNAMSAFGGIDPADYAPAGSCQKTFKEIKNTTRGTLQRSYTYTTECDATLDVTITQIFDSVNCEDTAHSVEGEIKGHCWSGQMTAAETLFESHGPTVYADGSCLMSSRISRNDKANTIRFNYEFKSCDGGYEHTQNIDTKGDEQDCCVDVTINGVILPYCASYVDLDAPEEDYIVLNQTSAGLVEIAEAAWEVIEPTLLALATEYCSETPILRSTSVSRNLKTGQLTYSYTYRCCDVCVSGAIRESVNITREFPSQVVAIIPILGRSCGPIIQDKGTKTVEKCSIAIDLTFSKECGCSYSKPAGLEAAIQGIISGAGVCSSNCHTVLTNRDSAGCDRQGCYLVNDVDSWNPRTGRYTRNITYILECCDS